MKDYSSIVVSSKIKLLRNLIGFEFPSVLFGDEGIKVLNKVADALLKIDSDLKLYKVKTLPELDINLMHEKGLISNKLIDALGYGAVLLSKDEKFSVMINESDHIVEQCKEVGLNLIAIYDKINEFDNKILSSLDIAFDDSIGFLTSSVADVGTGMRATITLFLPALTITGKIKEVMSSFLNQGVVLTQFGDDEIDTKPYTYYCQNSETIGKKETDLVVKVTECAIKICEMEVRARNELLSYSKASDVKDKVMRAWGILTNCYKIDTEEAQKLLGELKMGVALDLIRFKEVNFIDNLMVDIMPYSLTKISDSKVAGSELDKYRASFMARILNQKRIK